MLKKIVNLICMIAGIAVIVFGIAVKAGALEHVEPGRGMVPIVLGAVIVIWSLISLARNRR